MSFTTSPHIQQEVYTMCRAVDLCYEYVFVGAVSPHILRFIVIKTWSKYGNASRTARGYTKNIHETRRVSTHFDYALVSAVSPHTLGLAGTALRVCAEGISLVPWFGFGGTIDSYTCIGRRRRRHLWTTYWAISMWKWVAWNNEWNCLKSTVYSSPNSFGPETSCINAVIID